MPPRHGGEDDSRSMTPRLTRRRFCSAVGAGVAAAAGCRLGLTEAPAAPNARIIAVPGIPPTTQVAAGIHSIVVGGDIRDCWLVVPTGYDPSRAWPMAVFFRGAVTPARNYMDSFQPAADEFGMILLAPEARGRTWDLILGQFGPDVSFINAAIQEAYRTVHVDRNRVYCSGFSDGASYSLSLGLTNGDVFPRVAAYSPGFIQAAGLHGHPEFFITHGTQDVVLPIETTSRQIVPELRLGGYDVDYREFDGPHAVSLSLFRSSIEWMARTTPA